MHITMKHVPHVATLVALISTGACDRAADITRPPAPAASAQAGANAQYTVVVLPSPGVASRGNAINDAGSVAGFSDLASGVRHATLWRNTTPTDLGTLGGPNSSVVWPGISNNGWVAGIAERADSDPNNEDWSCSAFFPSVTHHVCRGFAWHEGVMTALPTFGGTNGFATEVNERGQIVGWAETPVHDPTCVAPQVLQFRAAIWNAREGTMRQLRPLPGDSTSAATAVNDEGVAVGISGLCDVAVGEFSANHAVLWDREGNPTDIGNLGGQAWHTPMDINQRGDVVGFSNPRGVTGGAFGAHAFLWTRRDGMRDLGVLPGDEFSEALGINARGQVIGVSCGDVCHPFIWQNGVMRNLNDLVAPGSPNTILTARHINDAGQITGNILDASTGTVTAFVATPNRA